MKKLSPLLILVTTLLLLFIVSTVLAGPTALQDQPADPGSDGPLNGSEVESSPSDQSQTAAITASADGYLYALREVNGGGNLLYGFRSDALSGALSPLPGFPLPTGGLGSSATISELAAYDAANARLFVANNGNDTISAYDVDLADGSLTALPYSPISTPTGLKGCVAVHPSGSPVVVGDFDNAQVLSFNITAGSATPAAGSPFPTSDPVFSCAFSQDGAYLYASGDGTNIDAFAVDAATGVLTPLSGSPFASGGAVPIGLATDQSGRLFSAYWTSNQVRVHTTSAGIPSAVIGNPFTSGLNEAAHGVLHPAGYYMVADRSNQVGVYEIDGSGSATTLTAVSGSPFASGGTFTDVLALNRSGAFLYAANGDSRNITTYAVNAGTGGLTNLGVQPPDTLGNSGIITGMAFAPVPQDPAAQGGFVYALEAITSSDNKIHGFQVDRTSGVLYPLPGFPIDTGGFGTSATGSEFMTYDARNERLFVINNGSNTVSAFAVDRNDGSLTALPYSPFSTPPGLKGCIAVHPNGSPLVIGHGTGALVYSYNINAGSAVQATGSPFATGGGMFSCIFSRNGTYFYGGGDSNVLDGFNVNTASGVLSPLSGSPYAPVGNIPLAFAMDKYDRLFLANWTANEVRGFTTAAGIPSDVSGNPFTSGLNEAIHGVLHRAGYYMVADRGGDQVGVYEINGKGAATTLTAVPGSPFASGGAFTNILALNYNQNYLFAANGFTNNITSFRVNPANGDLNGVSIQPFFAAGDTGRLAGMAYVDPILPNYLPVSLSD